VEGVVAFSKYCVASEDIFRGSSSFNLRSGHSSPGNLHLEHVLSYGLRQMPQTSSSGMSQRQAATAFHSRMVTFMVWRTAVGSWVGRNGLVGMIDGDAQQTRLVLAWQNHGGESAAAPQ
jgi:hypothetical protein